MNSITLTVTGNSSELTTNFHPEIELDPQANYSCCLLDFYSYNSIPNIDERNNKLYYTIDESGDVNQETNEIRKKPVGSKNMNGTITVPVGSYEIAGIIDYLTKAFEAKKRIFRMSANKHTMKCKLDTDVTIDFMRRDSIGSVLGFGNRIIPPGVYTSDNIVNIQHLNNIRIDCDLTSGSFHNGVGTHTIYEFSPTVDPGYKMNEQPKHLIYLPVIKRRINTLTISIVDQNGDLIDFRGEQITCRIHIKRDS